MLLRMQRRSMWPCARCRQPWPSPTLCCPSRCAPAQTPSIPARAAISLLTSCLAACTHPMTCRVRLIVAAQYCLQDLVTACQETSPRRLGLAGTQTGIALFADRMPVDLVSQFFLEQMLGLGYFATSISLNILAVRPPSKVYGNHLLCLYPSLTSHYGLSRIHRQRSQQNSALPTSA